MCLIEAKSSLSTDFLVRQLYYPFRLWTNKITKPIRPVFLLYSNGTYYFFEYALVSQVYPVRLSHRSQYDIFYIALSLRNYNYLFLQKHIQINNMYRPCCLR